MTWTAVADELPDEDQPILFVNDISQNPQDKFIHELVDRKDPMRTVKFGYVQEINVANPDDDDDGNHENWVEVRASKYYDRISGINGRADHVTHWRTLPELPE